MGKFPGDSGKNPQHPVQLKSGTPFARAVLDGLARPQKSIPREWLYDQRGAELFEQITDGPGYYPTRAEIDLLDRHGGEIAAAVGAGAVVVEYGQAGGRQTPRLLAALARPQAYLPVVLAAHPAHRQDEALHRLRQDFPGLVVHPVRADADNPVSLPGRVCEAGGGRLGFFPGSALGSLSPDAAVAFLQGAAGTLGPRGMMLIGIDTTRDSKLLMPAYDDAAGLTEAFNRNL
ncbi:MAG TPA: L-histidine N(alpha)-methyltransferase, partial [Rhodocyclaceae bacterium]|nr:L-histidine N(alpha)-methyltransferase [Rhodocyclaceae bacterium]